MTAAVASTERKLTAEDLEQARPFLQHTQNSIVGATKGLSEAQWQFKPAPDRWSILENLDHVVVVLDRVLGPVIEQLDKAPAPPAEVDPHVVDTIVIHQFTTRLARFQAPEFIRPVNGIAPDELLHRLRANYARMVQYLESKSGLRQHAIEAPPLRAVTKGAYTVLDGYQWILTAAAHTERHALQMLEVMADPGYPVKETRPCVTCC